jgi:hypothetical protein
MKYKIITNDNWLVMVSKSLKDIKNKFARLKQQGHKPQIIREN